MVIKRRITIQDIAAQANVSTATVSHVLNHTRFVSDEITERVRQVCLELGYSPNSVARSLRSGKTRTIGLVLPDSSNPFFAKIGHYLEENAFADGYSVIICNTENDAEKEIFYINTLGQKKVDGIIFVSSGEAPRSIEALRALNIPVVIADRDLQANPGDSSLAVVLTDNYLGGQLAAQHALDLGHRRLAMISGPSNLTPSALRETGFRDTLNLAGVAVNEDWIARGDFSFESGYQATQEIFRGQSRPTALFCGNDLMAVGAVRALFDMGLTIPGDVSVIGFDDIDLAAYLYPSLTTIQQPIHEISSAITRLLFAAFESSNAKQYDRVILKPTLVVRQSTAKVIS